MGSMDRAALDVRQARNHTTPTAPDNGAAEKAALLELDLRERALALAIKAMEHGLNADRYYPNPEAAALAIAEQFLGFLKDGPE